MVTRSSSPRSVSFGKFARRPAQAGDEAGQDGMVAVEALPEDAVEVGAITDAYGVKGWLRIAPHAGGGSSGGALLRARMWWLAKGSERYQVRVTAAKVHSATVVAQLAGCSDRDAALALRGFTIRVRRTDFPPLEREEYYWVDLIGLAVVNEAGEALGTVGDLIDNGAHSVLRVEYAQPGKDGGPGVAERLIPFVDAYVKTVDQEAGRIVVDWGADY
jgi:16S rRNA processing protein RimM